MNDSDKGIIIIGMILLFFLGMLLIVGIYAPDKDPKKVINIYVMSEEDILFLSDIKRLNDKIHQEFKDELGDQ